MSKTVNSGLEDGVVSGAKEVRYFATVMGSGMGQDAPAEVKRKIDGYLVDGWTIIYTLMKDNGGSNGLNIYHVLTR